MPTNESFTTEQLTKAERFRSQQKWTEAIGAASVALGGINSSDYPIIASDENQFALFLGLTRVLNVSHTSRGNRRVNPVHALDDYFSSAAIADGTLNNLAIHGLAWRVTRDPWGNPHEYAVENDRDVALTAINASAIYGLYRARRLREKGEAILDAVAERLPDTHTTKPLIRIESVRSRVLRGGVVGSDLRRQVVTDIDTLSLQPNPERVAITAARVVVMGMVLDDDNMQRVGERVFGLVVNDHPQFESQITIEERARKKREVRMLGFQLTVPLLYAGWSEKMGYTYRALTRYRLMTANG